MIDHGAKIFGRAAVVKANKSIRFLATSAKIPGESVPARVRQGRGHAAHIALVRGSLQSMRQDCQPVVVAAKPAQVEEIAVSQFETLRFEGDPVSAPQEGSEDSLNMAVAQQEGRVEFTLNDRHGLDGIGRVRGA